MYRQELEALRLSRAGSVKFIVQSLDGKGRRGPRKVKTDGHYTDNSPTQSEWPAWACRRHVDHHIKQLQERVDLVECCLECCLISSEAGREGALTPTREKSRQHQCYPNTEPTSETETDDDCVERCCVDEEELSSALSLITPILESESMQDMHAKELSPAAQDWYRDWLSPKSSGRLRKKLRDNFDTSIKRTPFSPPQARFDALEITDRIESTLSSCGYTGFHEEEPASVDRYSALPRMESLSDSDMSSDSWAD